MREPGGGCVVERPGAWQDDLLFSDQNAYTYVDLTDYEAGIRKLCSYLGTVYHPAFTLPRDRDFECEVRAIPSAKLDLATRQGLLDAYSGFRRCASARPHVAIAPLVVLVDRISDLGLPSLLSPGIALGVLHAEAGEFRAAKRVFTSLLEGEQNDPRLFAGLAGALFHLGELEAASRCYETCIDLIARQNEADAAQRGQEMTHNLVRLLISMGQEERAWKMLAALSDCARREPYVIAVLGRLHLKRDEPKRAREALEEAYARAKDPPWLLHSIVSDLSDCYRALHEPAREVALLREAVSRFPTDPALWKRLADYHVWQGDFPGAISALERAVAADPTSTAHRAELASLLAMSGHETRAAEEARHAIRSDQPGPEHYYRGLAFSVLGLDQIARFELNEARRDPAVRTWPEYPRHGPRSSRA